MKRRNRQNAGFSFSVPECPVRDTRMTMSLTLITAVGSEWWNQPNDLEVLPMKLITKVLDDQGNAHALPIGSVQGIVLRADDFMRHSRWSHGIQSHFSKMYPRSFSIRIKNVAPVGQRRGVLTAAFLPLTAAESLADGSEPVRADDAPQIGFDELVRVPGARTASADMPMRLNHSVPIHDWMREGVMCGAPPGLPGYGSPVGRLYIGYRDLANRNAEGTGLYGPTSCCLAVDITTECGFGGFGIRILDNKLKPIYNANAITVIGKDRRFDVPCTAVQFNRDNLSFSSDWANELL